MKQKHRLSLNIVEYTVIDFIFYNIRISNNNKRKKKIYNARIVINHESEARAVAMWLDGVC